jgi:hypothetical protein
MKAKTFCSLAVLIILLSTISYSQTLDAPKIKGKACYDLMKEQSECDKSNIVLSIGGGFAGLFEKRGRPNGFNIQADLLYPVSKYFALNIGLNFVRFPESINKYSFIINDSINTSTGNNGILYHVNIAPGISFGNISRDSKFNYYITAGFGFGYSILGERTYYKSINNSVISEETYKAEASSNFGIFSSGRFSYRIANKYNVYIEPSVYGWSMSGESNYHINGGISLNL